MRDEWASAVCSRLALRCHAGPASLGCVGAGGKGVTHDVDCGEAREGRARGSVSTLSSPLTESQGRRGIRRGTTEYETVQSPRHEAALGTRGGIIWTSNGGRGEGLEITLGSLLTPPPGRPAFTVNALVDLSRLLASDGGRADGRRVGSRSRHETLPVPGHWYACNQWSSQARLVASRFR